MSIILWWCIVDAQNNNTQIVNPQNNPDAEAYIEYMRNPNKGLECPTEALIYYKGCKGSLKECSTCLGNAERKCIVAPLPQGKQHLCDVCTAEAGRYCNTREPVCFGNQECIVDKHKCINFKCTLVRN